jgi:hypothetical protein
MSKDSLKHLDILEKISKKVEREEHFHFLSLLIRWQALHKYDKMPQYEVDYMKLLNSQVEKLKKK